MEVLRVAGARLSSWCRMASLLLGTEVQSCVLSMSTPICASQALSPALAFCLSDVSEDLTLCVPISEATQAGLSSRCCGLATVNFKAVTLQDTLLMSDFIFARAPFRENKVLC